jgi:hypothetical protein
VNVPATVEALLTCKPELYPAFCTVLGLESLHDVLEVIEVEAYNAHVADERRRAAERGS